MCLRACVLRRIRIRAARTCYDHVAGLLGVTLADRLVVMNAGRMEQVGTALEVFQRPASTFVAGFIGSPPMNFLAATVEAPGRLRLENGAALAYDEAQASAMPGMRVTMNWTLPWNMPT